MQPPIIIIGIGQLGRIFANAFLYAGYPVYPIVKHTRIDDVAAKINAPACVLVAVSENDLTAVLPHLPSHWSARIALLQNELLPYVWENYLAAAPTVISVWFEKKKGQDIKVLLPSPLYGPKAALIADALEMIDIPCLRLSGKEQLIDELVIKNVFIFMTNICGLYTGGTTHELWKTHGSLARSIGREVIRLQERLTGATFSENAIFDKIKTAIESDPEHKCKGRSAPQRLKRILSLSTELKLDIPQIRSLHSQILRKEQTNL